MLKEESTGVETESSGGCFYEGLWLKRKNSSSGAWGARPLSSGGGGREPEEIWPCGILSLSISNDWLKVGIKWVNKHLKWSEFNQMWIVLDGFFLASAIWCLAEWKPSFLWFLVYSSTAMKNSLRLKDFCANGKKKKKRTNPRNNGSSSSSRSFHLSALNRLWSEPCTCVYFEIECWANNFRGRSRSVARCW